jgi:hypothetical protein
MTRQLHRRQGGSEVMNQATPDVDLGADPIRTSERCPRDVVLNAVGKIGWAVRQAALVL